MKSLAIIILQIILYLVCSCCKKESEEHELGIRFNLAFKNKDTLFLKKYVDKLQKNNLNDFIFYGRVNDLSSVSNFYFGNERVCSDSVCERWNKLTINQKDILRYNVFIVYKAYVNSPILFDKKITWDETIEKIHKKYYTVENKFTQNQIIKIKNDIKRLGK